VIRFARQLFLTSSLLILSIAAPAAQSTALETKVAKATVMEPDCLHVARNTSLTIELDIESRPHRALVHFSNRTGSVLWFPVEKEPSYKPDEHARTLTIWFGYFDDVYGPYKGRYMVPAMRMVAPDGNLDFELTAPALLEKLGDKRLLPHLMSRVATKQLAESRTRGQQPLEDYLQHSCTIESPVAARPR